MKRPRILLTRRWPEAPMARLATDYDLTFPEHDSALTTADLRSALGAFDAICPTVTDRLPADMFRLGQRARIIANYGAGLDHIDLNAARDTGLVVTNTPDVLTEATAELTILLMLATTRRAAEGLREVAGSAWSGWRPTHLVGQGLQGRRLGLIGYGRIARATGRIAANAFGMSVDYYARSTSNDTMMFANNARWRPDLSDVLSEADVVSIHLPGGSATNGLIDAKALAMMKPTAVLINTARGSIIDEAALIDALETRRIAGVGLDVFPDEPHVNPRLLACANAFLLPHLGSATETARNAMGMRVAHNLDRFFAEGQVLDPAW